jgi:hypothetical protein
MNDLASWLVAAGTLALAIATGWLGWQTRESVRAAASEAKSTTDLVAETRRDRELEFRPYVNWTLGAYTNTSEGPVDLTASQPRNLGRGPALNVVLVVDWRAGGHWFVSNLGDIAPGAATYLAMRAMPAPEPSDDLFGIQRAEPWRAAFCQDQLGNSYRFLPNRVDADVWGRDSDGPTPSWLDFYRLRLGIDGGVPIFDPNADPNRGG